MDKDNAAKEYQHSTEVPHTVDYLWIHILNILKKSKATKVLDIGCGNGSIAKKCFEEGFEIVGIEPSESGNILKTTGNQVQIGFNHFFDHFPECVGRFPAQFLSCFGRVAL